MSDTNTPATETTSDPAPGAASLVAYQLRLAAAKRAEHETMVNSIIPESAEKIEAKRRALEEVEEGFFGLKEKEKEKEEGKEEDDEDEGFVLLSVKNIPFSEINGEMPGKEE